MTHEEKKKQQYVMGTVDKALKLLDIFSVKSDLSLAELSRIANMDKTIVFKLLFTLERRGYVQKSADAKYRLGMKFADYGNIVSKRQSLADIAKPDMDLLSSRTHQTVFLSILNTNGRCIIMQVVQGDAPGSASARIGYEIDSYASALGKLLLAYLPPATQKEMVDNLQFRAHTPSTITAPETLLAQLPGIRARGYAIDIGERSAEYSGIAAPIFDGNQRCAATLSIVCENAQFEENRNYYLPLLQRAAEDISVKIRY